MEVRRHIVLIKMTSLHDRRGRGVHHGRDKSKVPSPSGPSGLSPGTNGVAVYNCLDVTNERCVSLSVLTGGINNRTMGS